MFDGYKPLDRQPTVVKKAVSVLLADTKKPARAGK